MQKNKKIKNKKIEKIFFISEINASEYVAINCHLLKRQYLSSDVNGLTNSPKFFHIIKTDFFLLNIPDRDQ